MKAHEILSDESKWTKGCTARNSSGDQVSLLSRYAVCFCVMGAIGRVYDDNISFVDASDRLLYTDELDDFTTVAEWNDAPERTYAEVHDLLVKLDI